MTHPRPGDVLAERFVIEGPPLGAGLTGVVLPAFDEVAARPVAAKCLHEHLVDDPGALDALRAEAGAASRVRHPHLLAVYGLWSDRGRHVLITERLASRPRPSGAGAVIAAGIALASALEAIHAIGRVHGDVRPGHVLHTDRGAVLLGFGQSSVRAPAVSLPGQTAPEVVQGSPRSVAADLYGLGVVLYELLAGGLPWSGPTPWAVLGAQQAGPPRPVPGPRGLSSLVAELLRPEPDLRPPDARAVRRALERLVRLPGVRVRFGPVLGPIDLLRGFVVHGTDPETGAPARIAAGLGRRQAAALVDRLREQGWLVVASREALGVVDLAIVVAGTLLCGLVLPLAGWFLGFVLLARWRTGRLRPRIRSVLPPPRSPVPPRQEVAGREHAVVIGALLLAAAVLLKVQPWLAMIPLLLVALIVTRAWGVQRRDALALLRERRLSSILADARLGVTRSAGPIDTLLLVQGELDALEAECRAGRIEMHAAIEQASRLRDRAWAPPRLVEAGVAGVSRSLRDTPDPS